MTKFTIYKCSICGGRLELISDNIYECQACHRIQKLETEDMRVYNTLITAIASRESLNFRQSEIMCKNLIKQCHDTDLSDVYWNLLLCEQRVIFEVDQKGEQFPSFYDIVPSDIDESENYEQTLNYAQEFNPDKLPHFAELANKLYDAKNKYTILKNTSEPYDIFICFKKTDLQEPTKLTKDYQVAYDLYNRLSKNYNVFFSERSLDNIAFSEYEPNIYHALYTSKIMLVICSDINYLESQWVKNEWSRFKMMTRTSATAKRIIPIFANGFAPEELPEELRSCQGLTDDRHLMDRLLTSINAILKPVDREAEIAASIEAKVQSQMETLNSKIEAASKIDIDSKFNELANKLSSQQTLNNRGNIIVDTAEIKRLGDQFFNSGKYTDAKNKYLEYLKYKPSDYYASYLCSLCDVYYDLNYSNIISLIKSTSAYVTKVLTQVTHENIQESKVSLVQAYNIVNNRLSAFFNEYYENTKGSYVFSEEWEFTKDKEKEDRINEAERIFKNYAQTISSILLEIDQLTDNTIKCVKEKPHTKFAIEACSKIINDCLFIYDKPLEFKGKYKYEKIVKESNATVRFMNGIEAFLSDSSKNPLDIMDELNHYKKAFVDDVSKKFFIDEKDRTFYNKLKTKADEYPKYIDALILIQSKKYFEAYKLLKNLSVLDSRKLYNLCDKESGESRWNTAVSLYNSKRYKEAKDIFTGLLTNYPESNKYIRLIDDSLIELDYQTANNLFNQKRYQEALAYFAKLSSNGSQNAEYKISSQGYKDSNEKYKICGQELKKNKIKNNRPATLIINITLSVIALTMFVLSFFPSSVYPAMHWSIFLVIAIVILIVFFAIIHHLSKNKKINAPLASYGILLITVFCTLWVIAMPKLIGIEISTPQGLNAIYNYRFADFTITQDIDCSGHNLKQIKKFNQKINGNGHIISNLTIYDSWIETYSGEEITNIAFKSLILNGNGLVTYNNGKITHITINEAQLNPLGDAGLICKNNIGELSQIKINKVSVNINNNSSYVGAIVATNESLIEKCGIEGLSIASKSTNESYYGGLAGNLLTYAKITDCYIIIDSITTSNKSNCYVGGLAGKVRSGNISNCYTILKTISNKEYIAGLSGLVLDKSSLYLQNIYAEGSPFSYRSYKSSKITSVNIYNGYEEKQDLTNPNFVFEKLGFDANIWCIKDGKLILKWETDNLENKNDTEIKDLGLEIFEYTVDGNNVTIIGLQEEYKYLTEITIPNIVTAIGKNAFQDCTWITNIKIPESVKSIGNNAFFGCTGLTSIDLSNVSASTYLEQGYIAFTLKNCRNIKHVTASASTLYFIMITKLYNNLFQINLDSLKDLYYNGTIEQFYSEIKLFILEMKKVYPDMLPNGDFQEEILISPINLHCTDGEYDRIVVEN